MRQTRSDRKLLSANLRDLLAREVSVLDPQDAKGLADVLAAELPPVYAAAPDLRALVNELVSDWAEQFADDDAPMDDDILERLAVWLPRAADVLERTKARDATE